MKYKCNVVATMIVICLMTSATYAQSGSLKVRFHVCEKKGIDPRTGIKK